MTRLVGLVGSLRQDSINRRLFRSLASVLPSGVTLEDVPYGDVPVYNDDLEVPEGVRRVQQQLADADGVLLVTPEFNYGIPGPLKNVLDWVSRPAYHSVLAQKPVTVLGTSPGPIGTARAQGQLKQVLLGMVSHVFPHPEVAIGLGPQRFSREGTITEAATEALLKDFVSGFARFVQSAKSNLPRVD